VIKKESFEITILGNVCLGDEVGVGHGLLNFKDWGSLLKSLIFFFFSEGIDERGGNGLIWVIILKEFGSSTGIITIIIKLFYFFFKFIFCKEELVLGSVRDGCWGMVMEGVVTVELPLRHLLLKSTHSVKRATNQS
jgi:hypothetical protein